MYEYEKDISDVRHPMTAPKANEPTNIPMKEPMDLKKAAAVKFCSEYSSTVLKIEKDVFHR